VPTTRVNGLDLYYEVHGQGAPILGIHGTPSSALLWVDAARELGTRGKCIIYDRRGFYRSERPRWFTAVDLGDHVEDAAALLDALSATPAVVIGRSTGGEIALELAHRHPGKVKALALLEPAIFTLDPEATAWADQVRARVLRTAEKDPSSAAETLIRDVLGDRSWESLPDTIRAVFTSASPAVLAEMRGRGLDLSDDALFLSGEDLATIGQPTLLVSAESSPRPLRRVNEGLAAALPHADHVLVAGGHLIHPAHPAILDFLDRVLTPVSHHA
jgi:pimeloyl-ACP methyl ester carboxylesterase